VPAQIHIEVNGREFAAAIIPDLMPGMVRISARPPDCWCSVLHDEAATPLRE
jgi:hypothetical protein